MTMIPLDNIDELVRETQASSFTTITATTTEGGAEDLDDLLLSLEAFQEDCRKRLSHLTERKDAMREPGVVTTEEECYTDAVKEEENVESGSEKGDKEKR
ncbi:hypothetical protein O3P69_010046 [Scylla paramamosain]|uniref:Uncharacterized protein n=1 Tax=Scylla paramamosain TaxID=85552 RepID=A0AAW0SNC6_SCYPA